VRISSVGEHSGFRGLSGLGSAGGDDMGSTIEHPEQWPADDFTPTEELARRQSVKPIEPVDKLAPPDPWESDEEYEALLLTVAKLTGETCGASGMRCDRSVANWRRYCGGDYSTARGNVECVTWGHHRVSSAGQLRCCCCARWSLSACGGWQRRPGKEYHMW
jgi:hypothetical protein